MNVSRLQALVLLSIALAGFPARGQQSSGSAEKIKVAVVRPKSATIKHSYKYRIGSPRRLSVKSPVGGWVAEVLVKEGQAVKRGDPLFRVGPLVDRGNPEAGGVDGAVAIKATADGPSFKPAVRSGDHVREGDVVATFSDIDGAVGVEFCMPERHYIEYMTELGKGRPVPDLEILLPDGTRYPHVGWIDQFLASLGNQTGEIGFGAVFPNPDGVLRPGQAGTLVMSLTLKDAIVVPRGATFEGPAVTAGAGADLKLVDRSPSSNSFAAQLRNINDKVEVYTKPYVYVVGKDHVARRRGIAIWDEVAKENRRGIVILDPDDLLVLKEGVKAGERIVVGGVERVRDGDRVE